MSGFITEQTFKVGDTLVITGDRGSMHLFPTGQKVVVDSATPYRDIVQDPTLPLSTEIDPYSYGVICVEPILDPEFAGRVRYIASDEAEVAQ